MYELVEPDVVFFSAERRVLEVTKDDLTIEGDGKGLCS
jgi:hypothetical protein